MSKFVFTLIAVVITQNAFAFGETVNKPAPMKTAPAAKPQTKPAAVPAPAPKKVVAPAQTPTPPAAPSPDSAKLKAAADKAAADNKAATQAARQAKLAQKRKKEDDLISFVNQNESCSSEHAWGRIKDSGFTEASAPARVKTAVRNSIHPNSKGCQVWLVKNATASSEPTLVVAPLPVVESVASPSSAPAPSAADKAAGAVSGLFSKIKASVKQGATSSTCSQAERAMNACR